MSECVQCGQKLLDGHALNGVCDKCRGQSELPSSTGSVAVFAENFTIVEACEHMICIFPRSGKGKGMVAVLTKEQAAKIAAALVPKVIVPEIQPENSDYATGK